MVLLSSLAIPPAAPAACMTTSSRTESPPTILPTFDPKPVPQVHYDLEAGPEPDFLSPGRRLTPRPTFLDGCFSPKDGHSTLKRQGSSDLVRYFVCPPFLAKWTYV